MPTRRRVVQGIAATPIVASAGLSGCARDPAWCDEPQVTDDGAFPYPESCPPTASNAEGPFYLAGAPERADLDVHGDEGTPVHISGVVYDGSCDTPLAGAQVEIWHADPDGKYDNKSEQMRYRGVLICDELGQYELRTLLPGRYLNGSAFRPRHIHVTVLDAEGAHRLTTQLYFEGDPYLTCDALANTSLVMPTTGSEDTEVVAEEIWLVV